MEAFTEKLSDKQYTAFMIAVGAFIGLPIMGAFLTVMAFGPALAAVAMGAGV